MGGEAKTAILVELTVCFETNFQEAQERKEEKHSKLTKEVEEKLNGFDVVLTTIEVGSRGFVNHESFHSLQDAVDATYRKIFKLAPSRLQHSYQNILRNMDKPQPCYPRYLPSLIH